MHFNDIYIYIYIYVYTYTHIYTYIHTPNYALVAYEAGAGSRGPRQLTAGPHRNALNCTAKTIFTENK